MMLGSVSDDNDDDNGKVNLGGGDGGCGACGGGAGGVF